MVLCVLANDHLVVAAHHGQVVGRCNGVDVALVVFVDVVLGIATHQ